MLNKKGIHLQPHVVVLCNDVEDIDDGKYVAFSVITSDLIYEMPTVVAAVDVCLKCTFVFSLQYNAAARSSWLFLQHAVYGIETKQDKFCCKVKQLIAETSKAAAAH